MAQRSLYGWEERCIKRFGLAVLILMAALATACNSRKPGDDDTTIGTAGGGPVAEDGDRRFVERMLDADLAEIDLARNRTN